MTTRLRLGLILAAVLVAVAVFVWTRPDEQQTGEVLPHVRIGTSVDSFSRAPLLAAIVRGFFADHGLDVEVVPMGGSTEIRQALASGDVDFGFGGAPNYFPLMEEGAPMRIIGTLSASPTYLFVRPDSLETMHDLEGSTVASSPGSSETYFRSALQSAGVDQTRVTFDYSDDDFWAVALMERQSIDAVIKDVEDEAQYRAAGAIVLPEWIAQGYDQHVTPRSVMLVNTDYLAGHHEETERFLEALFDGHRFVREYPQEAAEGIAEYLTDASKGATTFTADEMLTIWSSRKMVFSIWLDPQVFVDMASDLADAGELDTHLTVDDIFDFTFAELSQQAQHAIYGTNLE